MKLRCRLRLHGLARVHYTEEWFYIVERPCTHANCKNKSHGLQQGFSALYRTCLDCGHCWWVTSRWGREPNVIEKEQEIARPAYAPPARLGSNRTAP